jgi:hypothetical protein
MESTDPESIVSEFRPLVPRDFVESIRRLDFTDPKWLYGPVDDPDPYQGDIAPDGQLAYVDRGGLLRGYRGAVALASHGCDAVPERNQVATLVPVFSAERYVEKFPPEQRGQRIAELRGNRLTSLFYLPAVDSFPDRFIDFAWAAAVSTYRIADIFATAGSGGRLRLSRNGWYLFTAKLAHHVAHEERLADYRRRTET